MEWHWWRLLANQRQVSLLSLPLCMPLESWPNLAKFIQERRHLVSLQRSPPLVRLSVCLSHSLLLVQRKTHAETALGKLQTECRPSKGALHACSTEKSCVHSLIFDWLSTISWGSTQHACFYHEPTRAIKQRVRQQQLQGAERRHRASSVEGQREEQGDTVLGSACLVISWRKSNHWRMHPESSPSLQGSAFSTIHYPIAPFGQAILSVHFAWSSLTAELVPQVVINLGAAARGRWRARGSKWSGRRIK